MGKEKAVHQIPPQDKPGVSDHLLFKTSREKKEGKKN